MPRAAKSKNPKHKRMIKGIALRRKILIDAMGGLCEDCGTEGTPRNKLEFHHVEPRTWVARELSRWSRQKRYEEEWEPLPESTDEVPF